MSFYSRHDLGFYTQLRTNGLSEIDGKADRYLCFRFIGAERHAAAVDHDTHLPALGDIRIQITGLGFGDSQCYLFTHRSDMSKRIREKNLNGALRRMGYADKLTGHGMRATNSTALA
ncbi:hypothetical protein [Pseudomonas ogarae]|uniref:hypothetical protein n=1 Tax=Pseudomonas ogarae (strain DSM 112162 / CECT 30235 / F113) TaxID=1114970 RepID=UPI001C48DDE9|nr:hypothetical protein [Pseudomonas ogarae]